MRDGSTYRANQRSGRPARGTPQTPRLPMPRLNRSRKWKACRTYAEARIDSGAGTPVR